METTTTTIPGLTVTKVADLYQLACPAGLLGHVERYDGGPAVGCPWMWTFLQSRPGGRVKIWKAYAKTKARAIELAQETVLREGLGVERPVRRATPAEVADLRRAFNFA